MNVFDRTGAQVRTFDTPEIVNAPADIGVFSDGTLVIAGQGGSLSYYSRTGAFLGTITVPPHALFYGSYVDRQDNLFVCDHYGKLRKFDRAGQLLNTFALSFTPGDLIVAPDGTLWVTSRMNGAVKHLDAGGNLLGGFQTAAMGQWLDGIAMSPNGSLYVTSGGEMKLYEYSTAGALLQTIQIPGPVDYPLFLNVYDCGPQPLTYCQAKLNSVGCLPAIASEGSPSATATSGFTVRATNVRNMKLGLLLYGNSGRNGVPFQGGTLCVRAPLRRTPATSSGGSPLPASDCTGVYALDMNSFAQGLLGGQPLPELRTPGTVVDCQWWGRDPGYVPPNNTTLSDGLEYVVCL